MKYHFYFNKIDKINLKKKPTMLAHCGLINHLYTIVDTCINKHQMLQ